MHSQDPSDQLLSLVLRLLHTMRRHALSTGRGEEDINFIQMHAIAVVKEHEGMTMKEFARCMRVTSPSATSFVNRLVKLKWVERVADKDNRKLVRRKLAPGGARKLSAVMLQKKRQLRSFLSLLPSVDQRELLRLLSRLYEVLQVSEHQ